MVSSPFIYDVEETGEPTRCRRLLLFSVSISSGVDAAREGVRDEEGVNTPDFGVVGEEGRELGGVGAAPVAS